MNMIINKIKVKVLINDSKVYSVKMWLKTGYLTKTMATIALNKI